MKKDEKKNEEMNKEAMKEENQEVKPETIHGFNLAGFYDFLCGIGYNMMEGEREYGMVKKIVEYGFERKMVFKDQFCEWLCDMLPGVEILDVASFMNHGRLSKELIEALEKNGREMVA